MASLVAFVLFAIYLMWSLGPRQLGPGEFPPAFHQALEESLGTGLPKSLVFERARFSDGLGDSIVLIVGKIPHDQFEVFKDSLKARSEGLGVLPINSFDVLLDPLPTEQYVAFAGMSPSGARCVILTPVDEMHRVLIFDLRPSESLWRCFY